MDILGSNIEVSEARTAYNRYRLCFQKEADQAVIAFRDKYQNNASLDDVITKGEAQITQSIQPTIELCVKTLIDCNVLTVDQAQFEELYGGYKNIWGEAFLQLYDKYAEIIMDQKQLDEYRVMRRKSRGRWQGGGFGLSSALQGAATAGVLNILASAGHMVFNGIGKVVSSISAGMGKNKIFNDPNTYGSLAEGVWLATFSLHIALVDCLNRTGADPLPLAGVVGDEDMKNSIAFLNNAKLLDDTEQCRSTLIRSFRLNPYSEDWYAYALERFGDRDGSLETAGQYFGISTVQEKKARILDNYAKDLPFDTEELALAAQQKIRAKKEQLHYQGETEYTRIIKDAVNRYDLAYRSVENIVLPTRNEADIARQELAAIEAIETNINFNDLSSIAEAKERISIYTSAVAKHHQEALQAEWDRLDIEQRSVDTLLPNHTAILCDSSAQAQRFRSIAQKLSQRLQACGEGCAAEGPLQALQRQILTDGIPLKLLEAYQDEINSRLAQIDLTLRSTLGKEYPTREAARAAETVYAQIRADFETGNPRKNGDTFRQWIKGADFSDEIKCELENELFQLENSKELKTIKTLSLLSGIILLAIVIGSYFFSISGTEAYANKSVVIGGIPLLIRKAEVVEQLGFTDGFKNGLLVFGHSIIASLAEGVSNYLDGFHFGLIGNAVWLFLGLFVIIIKVFLLAIARYFVTLFVAFFQQGPLLYYIGYIIGAAIPIGVAQFSFDEDKQEENINRLKRWTVPKVLLTIFAVIAIAVISIYFISHGK